jgi:A/G-specific adenine glycosylase
VLPLPLSPALAETTDTGAALFVRRLLVWYDGAQRDLPWRRTLDAYAVWVSEMMLQQTQVATVIPFWTRWMERFPDIRSLAEAPLDDVLKMWQGLGYYARARNLHKAALVIVERHGGIFPSELSEVLALPGIGRYTAGAVCSIALGLDAPIVDANVIRVLCRYFGLRGDPKSPIVQAQLWQLAADLIPPGNASMFNQAMMELGALICDSRPRCSSCPVQSGCCAQASGNPERLPEFAPRPVFTTQTDVSAIIEHPSGDGRLLLVRRPEGGLWGGLYEFPRVTAGDEERPAVAAVRAAREIAGLETDAGENLGFVRHGVTTRKITLIGVACRISGSEAEVSPPLQWVKSAALDNYALSSPQVRLAAQVRAQERQPTLFE